MTTTAQALTLAGGAVLTLLALAWLWRPRPAPVAASDAPTFGGRLISTVIREPIELAMAQPHQILLSTGSIALMGQFAGSSGVVHPAVGYLIAGGVEWAYLRGLASDSRAPTRWGGILNWSAFIIVVLWGVLWVGGFTGAIDHAQGGWWLAAAHVVPIAWLSLCSAQTHRAAVALEYRNQVAAATEQRAHEVAEREERNRFDLEQEAEDRKLERWKEAQRIKLELRQQEIATTTATGRAVVAPATRNPIVVDGVEYPSIQAAADAHGITRQAMSKRLAKQRGKP